MLSFRYRIKPRFLRDVSKRDISTTILGEKISIPLGVAPAAMQRMAHPDGECANVKGKLKIDINNHLRKRKIVLNIY